MEKNPTGFSRGSVNIVILFALQHATFGQNNSFPSNGNVTIYHPSSGYRSYDVVNKNGYLVSRVEATTDGTGQLWLRDANGNYKVIIRSNGSASSMAGELVVGEYTTTSKSRTLYVSGTTEIEGKLYGASDFEIQQASTGYRAYDVVNKNGITVSRFESTTDASGQLWFKDSNGSTKVYIRSNTSSPSYIAGEVVIGEVATSSKGKSFYVKGSTWMEGDLDVDGKLRSEEVTVEIINGPDYVFEEDYSLRSLKETKEFIKENKHLPEIPSAKEMRSEGVELGQMNMKLLKKIEELTLYQIELLERLENLEDGNRELSKKVQALEIINEN